MSQEFLDNVRVTLCPPGNGVFTVNTAKERKEALHQQLFSQTQDVDKLWSESLNDIANGDHAVIMGVCSDTGGGILRGANWGPLFLRSTLLEHHADSYSTDLGDVRVIPHLLHDKYINEETIASCRKALYQDEQAQHAVSPLSIAENTARDFYQTFPEKGIFGIGGDHSISYALTKPYLEAKKQQGKRAAIIHFDAHTDLLKERLGIDICFGSWCTHILHLLDDPSLLFQLGIRSSGKPKSHWETTFGVRQFWAHEVMQQGAQTIANTILEQLRDSEVDELYVSFDIDALDAKYAAATGTPEPDGLTPEVALEIIELLGREFAITAADMMEIAPFVDTATDGHEEPEATLAHGAKISAKLLDFINKK